MSLFLRNFQGFMVEVLNYVVSSKYLSTEKTLKTFLHLLSPTLDINRMLTFQGSSADNITL